tara:strand:- start:29234 stop:29389 length:156 start_codon:yes stop_codon:yes gene_type:complete
MLLKVSWRVDYWKEDERCYLKGKTCNSLDEALHYCAEGVPARIVKVTEEEV